MKKQWIIVAVVVALLSGGAYMGLKLSPQLFPVEVGSNAPDFKAIDINTCDSVSFDQYKGQVVLLNIWATWCGPCQVEMPSIERLQQQLGPAGLRIVAVSIDDGDDPVVKAFQHQYGLTFQILHDKSHAIERLYQVTGYPETFVLNRKGQIVKKVIGPSAWDSPVNRDLIVHLLDEHA